MRPGSGSIAVGTTRGGDVAIATFREGELVARVDIDIATARKFISDITRAIAEADLQKAATHHVAGHA